MFFSSGLWYINILMVNGAGSLTLLFRIALLLNTCSYIIYYPLIKLQTIKISHVWKGKKFTWSQTISIWSKQNIEISILSFVFVHCNLSLHLSTPSTLAFPSCILDDFARRRHHLKQQWCLSMQVFFLVHPSHKQGDLVSPNLVLGITYLGVPKLFLLTLFK